MFLCKKMYQELIMVNPVKDTYVKPLILQNTIHASLAITEFKSQFINNHRWNNLPGYSEIRPARWGCWTMALNK